MEEKIDRHNSENNNLIDIVERVKRREPEAMLQLVQYYWDDIEYNSKFLRMPKEDAINTIIVEFLDQIINEN